MKNKIAFAESEAEIADCYPVMKELRPHLSLADFIAQVKRQTENFNFKLVYLADDEIKAVGGLRISEWLAGGKYLEIEDLVSKENERSRGYGGVLFDWILNYAKSENCHQIKLVSHVKRFAAHRFYLNKRMIIEAHYFSLKLD